MTDYLKLAQELAGATAKYMPKPVVKSKSVNGVGL